MGTDIDWLVERQNESGEWEYVDTDFGVYRNYQAFFALSGVRREPVRGRGYTQEPFFVPRFEAPPNPSKEILDMIENSYGPFDWRTLAELLEHDWSWTESWIPDVLDRMKQLGDPNKVRVTWWFD